MRTLTQKRQLKLGYYPTRNQTPLDYSLQQCRTELPLRQDLTLELLLDSLFSRVEANVASAMPKIR